MTEQVVTSRGTRSRRTIALLTWSGLTVAAAALWYGRATRTIQTVPSETTVLILAAFAAFSSIFAWMLYSPGRRASDEESAGLFFSGAFTLLPPCIIAFCLMPSGSPLRGWLVFTVFLFTIIAVMTPVPEQFFAVPRDRSSYFRPITESLFSGVEALDLAIGFDHLKETYAAADVVPVTRDRETETVNWFARAGDPWKDAFRGTGIEPTVAGSGRAVARSASSLSDSTSAPRYSETVSGPGRELGRREAEILRREEEKRRERDAEAREAAASRETAARELSAREFDARETASREAGTREYARSDMPRPSRSEQRSSANNSPTTPSLPPALLGAEPRRVSEHVTDSGTVSRKAVSGENWQAGRFAEMQPRKSITTEPGSSADSKITGQPNSGEPSRTHRPAAAFGYQTPGSQRSSEVRSETTAVSRTAVSRGTAAGFGSVTSAIVASSGASSTGAASSGDTSFGVAVPRSEATLGAKELSPTGFPPGGAKTDTPGSMSQSDLESLASLVESESEPDAASAPGDITMERVEDEFGGVMVDGTARVRFATGQKRANINITFSPPLPGAPEVECESVDDNLLRLKVPVRQTYGIRIEARRSDASTPLETEVGFAAVYSSPSRR